MSSEGTRSLLIERRDLGVREFDASVEAMVEALLGSVVASKPKLKGEPGVVKRLRDDIRAELVAGFSAALR